MCSGVLTFQEASDTAPISERLLQLVWHYQRLLRDRLQTVDGQRVRVLHPGFWNREAGPDFRGAVVQIGDGPVASGDVEIDLSSQGWHGHNHDQNPAYRKVILHVVWDGPGSSAGTLPTLPVKSFLDAPLGELKLWLGRYSLRKFSGPLLGQCCAPLRDTPPWHVAEMLRQAAFIRLQAKAAQFQARARQVGWEQSLWEGLFGALGYKHNVWPMRRVAELLPRIQAGESPTISAFLWQVRLLGVSGLLPTQLTGMDADANNHIRSIWDVWWRTREAFADIILPRLLWRPDGARPANHPQRRLGLAAYWLADPKFLSRLEKWFADFHTDNTLASSLLEVLQASGDDFWSWHWTFRTRRLAQPQPLLGGQRATDIAVNVVLPWFWMRAVAGKNETARQTAEHRYFTWPKAEDNAVLRLARSRLFGGRNIRFLKTAATQQGMLQIVHDFCDNSNALCDECQFPNLVRSLDG